MPFDYPTGPAAGSKTPSGSARANVARDLEAIFAPLPRNASGTPEQIPAKPAPTAAPARAPRRRNFILFGLIVALLGIAVVAAASWWLAAPAREVTQSAALRERPQPPVPTPAAPSEFAPTVSEGVVMANGDADPSVPPVPEDAPPASRPAVAPALAPAPAPRPDRTAPPTASEVAPAAARPIVQAPPVRTAAAAPTAPAPRSARACEPGATLSWCLRRPVAEADAALRDAYDAAVSAGVERSVLSRIRGDWSRLRRTALNDPQTLLRGYRELTEQLRLQTRQVRP